MQNQVNYDFVKGIWQFNRHILYYNSQCWGVRLEYAERTAGATRIKDIRLAISLKNIGTFLDLGHGSSDTL